MFIFADMRKFVLTLVLTVLPLICSADGAKLYTKRARVEDFTSKTTKVVLAGDALMQTAIREEVSTRWYISPFEFCTPDDYEKHKNSTTFYFLRPVVAGGIIHLCITKGGKTNDENILKRGFDVISIPMATAGQPTSRELLYIGAYVDILQKYMEEAMSSDTKAYGGLPQFNAAAMSKRKTLLECNEADRNFAESTPGYSSGLVIASKENTENAVCYKIVVTCDTHELCYFKSHKLGPKAGREFLKQDIAKINAVSAK